MCPNRESACRKKKVKCPAQNTETFYLILSVRTMTGERLQHDTSISTKVPRCARHCSNLVNRPGVTNLPAQQHCVNTTNLLQAAKEKVYMPGSTKAIAPSFGQLLSSLHNLLKAKAGSQLFRELPFSMQIPLDLLRFY